MRGDAFVSIVFNNDGVLKTFGDVGKRIQAQTRAPHV